MHFNIYPVITTAVCIPTSTPEPLADHAYQTVEYQAMYRDSAGNLRFAHGMDHSDPFRPNCVFGPGFREKLDDLGFTQSGVLPDDRADATMVGFKRVQG